MRKIAVHHLALIALPLYVACAASDDSEPPANTAGTSSAAGSSNPGTAGTGTAGTGSPGTAGTGTGGTGTGTAGTGTGGAGTAGTATGTAGTGTAGTGTGGTAPAGNCVAPTAATGEISTFEMANVANQLSAGTDVWSASPTGATATAAMGTLHVTSTAGSWASVSTVLNKGATCFNVDGKYTGIKFTISSPTNKSMKFIVVTPETKADSSHFGKVLTLTTAATETMVTFAELAKATFGAGMVLPVDYKPSQHVIGIGFGVMEEKELMDITLDNVSFY